MVDVADAVDDAGVVSVAGVSKWFVNAHGERSVAVDDVSFGVGAGRMVSIVGPSGSGKSTLLYCMAGLLPVDAGTVSLLGADVGSCSPAGAARLRRGRVGFVFQSLNLVTSLSVLENVLVSAQFAGLEVDEARARSILGDMGLERYADDDVSGLSGGQQQRVAVARVLYLRPRLVFADEPTGALDSLNAVFVMRRLRMLADAGSSVVVVTHSLEDACMADEALVLRDGRLTHRVEHPTQDGLFGLVGRGRS